MSLQRNITSLAAEGSVRWASFCSWNIPRVRRSVANISMLSSLEERSSHLRPSSDFIRRVSSQVLFDAVGGLQVSEAILVWPAFSRILRHGPKHSPGQNIC